MNKKTNKKGRKWEKNDLLLVDLNKMKDKSKTEFDILTLIFLTLNFLLIDHYYYYYYYDVKD